MLKHFFQTNFYKITTVIAVIVVLILGSQLYVKADDDVSLTKDTASQQVSTTDNAKSSVQASANLPWSPNLPILPSAQCLADLSHWSGGSSTYNANSPYNNLFMQSGAPVNQLIDINGDGLQDYVYSAYTQHADGNDHYNIVTEGCVYLNTGTGWNKVFKCIADIVVANDTGEITSQNYKGDCAGEPSSKSN